jgi:hypothetical protein
MQVALQNKSNIYKSQKPAFGQNAHFFERSSLAIFQETMLLAGAKTAVGQDFRSYGLAKLFVDTGALILSNIKAKGDFHKTAETLKNLQPLNLYRPIIHSALKGCEILTKGINSLKSST